MRRFGKQMHIKASQEDVERARQLASATHLSVSELVRVLMQMPAESVDKDALKAIDEGFRGQIKSPACFTRSGL